MTKLDVLSGYPEVKICVAYRWRGETLTTFPAESFILDEVEPVYETLPGWDEPLSECRSWEKLPANAQRFVMRLQELVGVPIATVSVGPERSCVLTKPDAPSIW